MRLKNTLEYLGLWEKLNNPNLKGGRIRPPFNGSRQQCFHNDFHTLGWIAYLTGYPNAKYFSTAFKKYYGTTPSTFIAGDQPAAPL